jgi:hypothetical protein
VSEFVEECRREWKRLHVPDAVADEMAADLTADLGEAAAEGVSAEEVLGSGARDPRSFAASWAAERGVIGPGRTKVRVGKRSFALLAIALSLAIATVAAGIAILATPSEASSALPGLSSSLGTRGPLWVSALPSLEAGLPNTVVKQVVVSPPNLDGSGAGTHTIAWALFVAGLLALTLSSLYWWRRGPRLRPQA